MFSKGTHLEVKRKVKVTRQMNAKTRILLLSRPTYLQSANIRMQMKWSGVTDEIISVIPNLNKK